MVKPLPILKTPNPVLRKKSGDLSSITDPVRKLAGQLIATLANYDHQFELGAAIAAPQVGESIKLIVLRKDLENAHIKNDPKKDFLVLINPKIVKKSGEELLDFEGCLSIPGIYGHIKRAGKVEVEAKNLSGKKITLRTSGFKARVLQHEIDHLSGILFTDHLKDMSQLYKMDSEGQLVKIWTPGKTHGQN